MLKHCSKCDVNIQDSLESEGSESHVIIPALGEEVALLSTDTNIHTHRSLLLNYLKIGMNCLSCFAVLIGTNRLSYFTTFCCDFFLKPNALP